MSKDKDNKGPIISAAIGAAFFAIPYVGLSIPILPSIGIAAAAFGAGNLLFSKDKKDIIGSFDIEHANLPEVISMAKKQNSQIESMINKIDSPDLRKEIKEITETSSKIIEAVVNDHDKYDKAKTFFSYYLPVTLKIITEYDNIENQFIIISSDGIWDLFEEKDIKEYIYKLVEKNKNNNDNCITKIICKNLIDESIKAGGWDNMSIYAIKLT